MQTITSIDVVWPIDDFTSQLLEGSGLLADGSGVNRIFILCRQAPQGLPDRCRAIVGDQPLGACGMAEVRQLSQADALVMVRPATAFSLGYRAIPRMADILAESGKGLVYGDYQLGDTFHPTVDFQPGSGRDSFDFGPLLMLSRVVLEAALENFGEPDGMLTFGAWYDLWLKTVDLAGALRIPEVLGHQPAYDRRPTGQQQHDYCDPANRMYQLEMETIFTAHLRRLGAWLPGSYAPAPMPVERFSSRASIIMPVLNRHQTVPDAVRSALSQQADFKFNVIVLDNHSTDGTATRLQELAADDDRLIHVIPDRHDLGIGGCWDFAVRHPACGRWAVQLDSDDVYSHEHVLQTIVNKLEEGPYAMVVGSYTLTDYDYNEIPPGLIDHQEWTPGNGHNNLLRVNGIGAPRAFDTAVLRTIGIPNITYGEDYAIGLRLTRQYELGRIFDSLYLCRRWNDNSDADLDIATANRYEQYKDRIRSLEMSTRRRLNGYDTD